MAKCVYLLTRDLVFRSKLRAVVATAGAVVTRDAAACDVAVIEIESADWEQQIQGLHARRVPVLAFGSHVHVEHLRRARALGALAVPNSEAEHRLAEVLKG